MDRTTITVYVTIDRNGQWEVAADRDDAVSNHIDNQWIGDSLTVHKLTLSVPLPQDISATITLPDDATGEPVVIEE